MIMNSLLIWSSILALVGSGVMAGLFFVFSNTIMSALGKTPPNQGAAAMQLINVVIVNPVFLLFFMGTGVLHVASMGLSLMHNGMSGSLWVLGGGALYLVGGLFVTIQFNVPLNESLAALDMEDVANADMWHEYLNRWVPWNHVRTFATIGSTLLGCIALSRG